MPDPPLFTRRLRRRAAQWQES